MGATVSVHLEHVVILRAQRTVKRAQRVKRTGFNGNALLVQQCHELVHVLYAYSQVIQCVSVCLNAGLISGFKQLDDNAAIVFDPSHLQRLVTFHGLGGEQVTEVENVAVPTNGLINVLAINSLMMGLDCFHVQLLSKLLECSGCRRWRPTGLVRILQSASNKACRPLRCPVKIGEGTGRGTNQTGAPFAVAFPTLREIRPCTWR